MLVIIIPMLPVRKLRFRVVQSLAQGPTAVKRCSQDLNPNHLSGWSLGSQPLGYVVLLWLRLGHHCAVAPPLSFGLCRHPQGSVNIQRMEFAS